MQAAVELLIGHRRWLLRADFRGRCVRLVSALTSDGVRAVVAWRAAVPMAGAGRLSCLDSEARMLRTAANIAEGVAVNLGTCLSTLDDANIGLVVDAVRHASGRVVAGARGRGDRW